MKGYMKKILLFLTALCTFSIRVESMFNPQDPIQRTLASAAHQGDSELALKTLNEGANPNYRFTLLAGIGAGSITSGVGDAPVRFSVNSSALDYASTKNIVDILVSYGADVNSKEPRTNITALHRAADKNNAEVIAALIDQGADINAPAGPAGQGLTPLAWATQRNHLKAMAMLISKGAKVDATDSLDETPLHHAARNGYCEAAQLLLNSKADIASKNRYGLTPLFLAITRSHGKMICLLVEHGASLGEISHLRLIVIEEEGKKRKTLGKTIFSLISVALHFQQEKSLKALLELSAPVSLNNLHQAILYGQPDAVKHLLTVLACEPLAQCTDTDNHTALSLAKALATQEQDPTTQETFKEIGRLLLERIKLYDARGGITKTGLVDKLVGDTTALMPELIKHIACLQFS
jgi:ankyrin repeat protein